MAIALEQTKTQNAGAYSNTNVAAFTTNITAGSLLILAITAGSADTIASITDTQSNTWNFLDSDLDERQTWLYWVENANAGATTVTVTFDSGQFPDSVLVMREYSGISTSSPLDVNVSGNDGGNYVQSHPSGTTGTTTQNDELVVAVIGTSGSTDPVFGVPSGYSNLASQSGFDLYTYGAIADKIVATTGTQSATFTTTEFVRGQVIVATFKGATAGTVVKDIISMGLLAFSR